MHMMHPMDSVLSPRSGDFAEGVRGRRARAPAKCGKMNLDRDRAGLRQWAEDLEKNRSW